MASTFYVKPGASHSFLVKYQDHENPSLRAQLEGLWKHFNRNDLSTGTTWYIWYRPANNKTQVTVDYLMPKEAPLGLYRVETFVPGKNATTRKAFFTVAHNFRIENSQPRFDDQMVSIDMFDRFDEWVSLGEYLLDPGGHMLSGRVRAYDLTMEPSGTMITFGPVRWVPLFTTEGPGEEEVKPEPRSLESKLDFPVGTADQRAQAIIDRPAFGKLPRWLENWYDANPYLSLYSLGYHTGADINSTVGPDADKMSPVYAIGDGKVVFAGKGTGTWGQLILTEHPDILVTLPNGVTQRQTIYARYGHLTDLKVKKGDPVTRGTQIAAIGLMEGFTGNWHLHFDICYNLQTFPAFPSHWPDTRRWSELDKAGKKGTKEWNTELSKIKGTILANYLDPLMVIKMNH
jgi:murein DD-endopeptidase MepM/ murein hydrolase activator NlpD